MTDALSNVTTFEYDAADRVLKQIDALLNERLFVYDDEDNVVSVTDARGQVTTFTYDSRDNLETATDPRGRVTTNTYDALNRLTQKATIDNLIALGYDLEGNVTSVADDDSELSFSHDGLNRVLTAATDAGGVQPLVTLTNAYDSVGNRTQLADDAGISGAVTGYAFDSARRLTQLTTPAGQPIGLGYDALGRVTGMTFPNSVSTTVSYDPLTGRLAQLTHAAGATPLADFGYGYNGVGNVTQVAELAQTRDFAYDDL